jgi:hypothetical protein
MYEPSLVLMQVVYAANVLTGGTVGGLSLFAPQRAARYAFGGKTSPSVEMRVAGLVRPQEMSPVFLLQLIYKALWLLVVALPAVVAGRARSLPIVMTVIFLVYLAVLPFAIPFGYLFR